MAKEEEEVVVYTTGGPVLSPGQHDAIHRQAMGMANFIAQVEAGRAPLAEFLAAGGVLEDGVGDGDGEEEE